MKHPIPKPSATFDPIDAGWRALLEEVQELRAELRSRREPIPAVPCGEDEPPTLGPLRLVVNR